MTAYDLGYYGAYFVAAIVLGTIWLRESFRHAALRQECERSGHVWQPAEMGDHPDATYVCARCFQEF